MGTLSLTTRYLSTPDFRLEEREALLSDRFQSLDEGADFVPTLAKNQQRESLSGSPGSLPIRTSLPKSPPSMASALADRFVSSPGPVHSRTTSLPQQASSHSPKQSSPLGINRAPTSGATAGSGSAISAGSSSRHDTSSNWSKDEGRPLSGIAARMRKESTGAGRGAVSIDCHYPGRVCAYLYYLDRTSRRRLGLGLQSADRTSIPYIPSKEELYRQGLLPYTLLLRPYANHHHCPQLA